MVENTELDSILELRSWRRRRLLTVRTLATAAQVAPRTIVDLESGRRMPRPTTIRAISAALEVAPEQVVEFRRAMALSNEEGPRDGK
jgi:transcriptional regulator with XRE-family HTH domain